MTTSEELVCNEFVELVTDYFEGALAPAERRRFEAHLAECDGCSIYLEQMRQTISVLGKLSGEEVPPEAKQELREVFRDWKED